MAEESVFFEAVLVPHRSLSPRGLRVLMGVLILSVMAMSSVFWLLGAWPVVGFSGVEVGLAAVLLRANAAGGRSSEMLLLSSDGLRVVRIDPAGRRVERLLPATWLRVSLEERRGRVPGLVLRGNGLREEVATALGEAEKRALAQALAEALHRWRNPVFDNFQLR
jgi:uncharacterized membrane protein